MTEPNQEDIDNLKKYAAAMSGETVAPDPGDVSDLQKYADYMQSMKDTGPSIIDNDAPTDAGPLAQTYTEKSKQGTRKPTADLAFGIPAQYLDSGMGLPPPTVNGADVGAIPAPKGKGFTPPVIDMTRPVPKGNWNAATDAALANQGATVTKRTDLPPPEQTQPEPSATSVASGTAAPPRITPEMWKRTNSPESRKLEGQIFGDERERELADNEINARAFNQKMAEEAGERSGQAYAEQERARADRERQTKIQDRYRRDLDAANKAYQTATVDPGRFFKQAGTGGSILAAIGVALGQFGASLTHTPNAAKDIIESAINHDIESQKAELGKKGQAANNMLARLRDQTGSLDTAESAYRMAAMQYAKAKTSELGVQGNDTALQQQLGDKLEELRAAHLPYIDAHTAHIPPMMIGGMGGLGAKDQENIFRAPDGTMYKARNAESYKKLTEGSDLYRGLSSDMADYQSQLAKLGPLDRISLKTGTPTEAASRASTTYTNMMGKIRQGNDDGVWKKSETEMLSGTVAPPDQLSGNGAAQVGAAKKHLDNMWNGTIKTHDPLPVQTGYKYDATGHLSPTAGYTGAPAQGVREVPESFKAE